MNFEPTINFTTHPAVVAPISGHHVEVNPNSGYNTGIAPVSWPTYLGGSILLGLIGMLIVALASASPGSRHQSLAAEVRKVHHANMLKNLEHRIEVARARGDQNLIHLLEQERHQLG